MGEQKLDWFVTRRTKAEPREAVGQREEVRDSLREELGVDRGRDVEERVAHTEDVTGTDRPRRGGATKAQGSADRNCSCKYPPIMCIVPGQPT